MSKLEEQDAFLALMVQAINGQEASMTVTLNVAGAVVTGVLISNVEYFHLASEMFAEHTTVESENNMADYTNMASEFFKVKNQGDESKVGYIHLKDAHFVQNGRNHPGDGMLWRGRLSEVAGFFFGQYVNND